MRIAILSPVAWRTPPLHYGPWEQIASSIAEGLVARGIDVTLFATLDSLTTAKLDGVCPVGYEGQAGVDGRISEALHVAHALARSADFDLIHNHLDWLPLAFARQWRAPMVTTIHGFSGRGTLPAYTNARNSAFVSISDSDRAPELEYVATVHHGIDLDMLPLSTVVGDSLVAFGRIHPDKGTAQAIEIARRAGRRLVICGIVQDARYFREEVEPHIDGDRVRYLGSVGPTQRAEILGSAAVLLHPIAFDEPFGLSVVEAMACGTPVLAYPRGSMREIVDEGRTGWLVEGAAAAAQRVDAAAALDRAAIRAVAERRFGVDRMVDEYLAIYRRILGRTGSI
jgi:glycosyltransferase involved in cell wall biosynthesis